MEKCPCCERDKDALFICSKCWDEFLLVMHKIKKSVIEMAHPLGLSNERLEEMREEIKHQDEYACLIFVSKVCTYCRVHGLEAGKILGELHDQDPKKKVEKLKEWLKSKGAL